MSCKGLHCNGCSGGGGKLAVIVVLAVIATVGRTVVRAAAEAGHVLAVALEVLVVGLAVGAAAVVLAGIAWAGVKVRRRHASRAAVTAAEPHPVYQAEVVTPEALEIEAPRPTSSQYAMPGIWEDRAETGLESQRSDKA